MFDANDKESLRKCEEFGADILKYCVKVGGALTGEHGVGIEKRELMCEAFNDKDIQQQLTIKVALDPNSLLNPGKVYPILRKCAEEGRVHVHGGKQSSQTSLDFNQNIFKPSSREEIVEIVKNCYKKIFL